MSALEIATAAGTPVAVLQQVQDPEFLVQCLKRAKFSKDLISDAADACEINELNALILGSGLLSVEDASNQLFLMSEEATALLQVCRQQCLKAGVNYGDGASYVPSAEDDLPPPEDEGLPDAPATTAAPTAASKPGPSSVLTVATSCTENGLSTTSSLTTSPDGTPSTLSEPGQSVASGIGSAFSSRAFAEIEQQPSSLANPPSAFAKPAQSHQKATLLSKQKPATPPLSARSSAQPSPTGSAKPPLSARPSRTPSQEAPAAAAPPVTSRLATPKTTVAAATATSSLPRQDTVNITPPHLVTDRLTVDSKKTSRPVSAVSSTPKPTGIMSPKAYSTQSRPQSAYLSTPVSTPSYAKPTQAYKARTSSSGTEDLLSPTSSTPVPLVTTPSRPTSAVNQSGRYTPAKDSERKPTVFANISSSLLRPTQAFLAWTRKKGETEADASASQRLVGGSQRIATPPDRNKGLTAAQPFKLSAYSRTTPKPLTSEELQLRDIEKRGSFKARPLPKAMQGVTTPPRASEPGQEAQATPTLTASTSRSRIPLPPTLEETAS